MEYKPGKRASDVMLKPLPQILDEMDAAITAANKATENANAAAEEARQAGQDAAAQAQAAAEKAVQGVAADLENHKTATATTLDAINKTLGWIKGILAAAGAIFSGKE